MARRLHRGAGITFFNRAPPTPEVREGERATDHPGGQPTCRARSARVALPDATLRRRAVRPPFGVCCAHEGASYDLLAILRPPRSVTGRLDESPVPDRARRGTKPADAARLLAPLRARSSVGERSLHTREVAGSKPAAPITRKARYCGLFFVVGCACAWSSDRRERFVPAQLRAQIQTGLGGDLRAVRAARRAGCASLGRASWRVAWTESRPASARRTRSPNRRRSRRLSTCA